jgi:hypothetical protein
MDNRLAFQTARPWSSTACDPNTSVNWITCENPATSGATAVQEQGRQNDN